MYRLVKINIDGRAYDCKIENYNGGLWLFHNCGGYSGVADDSRYDGSKRGQYYATCIAVFEINLSDDIEIAKVINAFDAKLRVAAFGEIVDKPQRIRKSNNGGAAEDAPTGAAAETPGGEAGKQSAAVELENINLKETINAELSALGKIGEMLAPNIVAAANAEANIQAKRILTAVIDEAAQNGGGACKVVEYHTARGVYKTDSTEVTHAKIETVTKAVEAGIGVYLYGPAGTGKSYLAKQVAKRLSLTYYETSKVDNVFDLIGFVDATGNYVYTQFALAYINGGLFFLDEFDASNGNAATAFNNALASDGFAFPGIGYKQKHENFRVIAAGNTIGTGAARDKYGVEYVTRNALDAATLTRFPLKILCDFCEEIEQRITRPYIGELSKSLIDFAHNLRDATAATNVQCTCCYREMKAIAEMLSLGIEIPEAINAVYGYLDNDDVKLLSAKLNGGGVFVEAFKKLAA